jgi:ADP-ribose pyrophosphatase
MVSVYRATDLKKTGDGGGDETEKITVHEVPLSEIHEWLVAQEKHGFLIDPKIYSALYFIIKENPSCC